MPNINDAFPSNYLKASDLKGSNVAVTIDHVAFEPVGRTKEMKAVVYFKGKEKGLILNKTNATKITQISGSSLTEDWDGVRMTLYPTETEFAGEMTECIRIKPAQQNGARPAPVAPPKPVEPVEPVEGDDIPF